MGKKKNEKSSPARVAKTIDQAPPELIEALEEIVENAKSTTHETLAAGEITTSDVPNDIQAEKLTRPAPSFALSGIKRKKHLERLAVVTNYPDITVNRVNYRTDYENPPRPVTIADTMRQAAADNMVVNQQFYDACSFAAKTFHKSYRGKTRLDIEDSIESGNEAFLIVFVTERDGKCVFEIKEEGELQCSFVYDFMDYASLLRFPIREDKTPLHGIYGFVLHCDENDFADHFMMTVFEAVRDTTAY